MDQIHSIPDQAAVLGDETLIPAESCVLQFPADLIITQGQSHSHVLLAKAMLSALSQEFQDLRCGKPDAVLDRDLSDTLRVIQRCSSLPETGDLDKRTWNRLARLYRAVFDRYHAPSCG